MDEASLLNEEEKSSYCHLEVGSNNGFYHSAPKEYYSRQYFERLACLNCLRGAQAYIYSYFNVYSLCRKAFASGDPTEALTVFPPPPPPPHPTPSSCTPVALYVHHVPFWLPSFPSLPSFPRLYRHVYVTE